MANLYEWNMFQVDGASELIASIFLRFTFIAHQFNKWQKTTIHWICRANFCPHKEIFSAERFKVSSSYSLFVHIHVSLNVIIVVEQKKKTDNILLIGRIVFDTNSKIFLMLIITIRPIDTINMLSRKAIS